MIADRVVLHVERHSCSNLQHECTCTAAPATPLLTSAAAGVQQRQQLRQQHTAGQQGNASPATAPTAHDRTPHTLCDTAAASPAHQQCCQLVLWAQAVLLAVGCIENDGAAVGIPQVDLAIHVVGPGGRVGVCCVGRVWGLQVR